MGIDYQEAPIPVIDTAMRVIRYGPWKGSMRSMPADRVPPTHLAETDGDTPSSNYVFISNYGTWKRRLGQTQKFDTFGSATGNLPAKWTARSRNLKEFNSDAITDHIPTVSALLTKETLTSPSTNLDDGRFSNLWLRDQVNSQDYTVGAEFSSTTYPATPGSAPTIKFVPLWHDSGDGGITRGITEFDRRFFFGGSRGNLTTGNWMYHPSFFGTPSRWRQMFAVPASQILLADATISGSWGLAGAATKHAAIGSLDDDTSIIQSGSGSDLEQWFTLPDATSAATLSNTGWILRMRVRSSGGLLVNGPAWYFGTTDTTGAAFAAGTVSAGSITTSYATIDTALSSADAIAIKAQMVSGTVYMGFRIGAGNSNVLNMTYAALITPGGNQSFDNRLIPSGPLPSPHAGTITHGTATTTAGDDFERPDADDTDGSWINSVGNNTDLFSYVDESTTDDTDYITVAAFTNSTCIMRLSDFAITPVAGDLVKLRFRAKRSGIISTTVLTGKITEGGVTRATLALISGDLTNSYATFGYDMTAAEMAAVVDWTNLKVSLATTTSSTAVFVSQVEVLHRSGTSATEGGWKGSDRFFYGIVPIFEDDSSWMPTIPRFGNNILNNGFNLCTVDASNLATKYDSVLWQNIPILWYGNKQKALVRSNKIDSTTTDNLALNPFDMRIVAIIDNSVTSYKDTFADDDSLQLDNLLVRYDHIMPPRARYIFGGDMRVCHAYGALNPCAILIAPVGRVADYDLNLADTDSTLYTADGSYMRITSGTQLELIQADGNATTSASTTLLFSTYNTLEKLVDAINATSIAANGQQWRAQMCPGVDPSLDPAVVLTPHKRTITSTVSHTTTSLTKAGGGLSKVAIGSRIAKSDVTVGTYVQAIVSDNELTMSAAASGSSTSDAIFYQWTGDTATTATANEGWQRVIAASLPGFLFLNRTYMDTVPTEKSSIWMTTATPGGMKSAPNAFSGKVANKFFPPNAKAGKAMGGVGIDQGFRVYFENQRGIIDNLAHTGSGIDEDYRLKITHEASGCCSWASISAGTRFGVCAAPEGIVASDLRRELLLSGDIWDPPSSESSTGTGDFVYEIPQSIAATSMDNDNAMLYTQIMRDRVYVNYRTSASTTHPNRQVVYDFSSGVETAGLEALLREGKEPFGWSTPLTRSMTCMGEGRRSDGAHMYGWNDQNAGSTGDGRIDEFETSETDNGTAISASATTPWFRDGSRKISFMKSIWEHKTTTGTTTGFDFHRSIQDETYSFTPSTSATLLYIRDPKEMTLPARSPTAAGFFGFRQTAGTAHEIRSIEVYFEELDTYS